MQHLRSGGDKIVTDDTSRATVLVVDDDEAIRRVFLAALQRAGYHTLEAASAGEALRLLQVHNVDLALLDMQMPGVSGVELANQIRADSRNESMGIVFVSGHGALTSKLAGLQAGGNDYLVKPVALEELLARVAAQLRERSLWLGRLDQQLAARSRMARQIANLDPSIPLARLGRELLSILSAELRLVDLGITRPFPGDPDADGELSIVATDNGTRIRVPLRFAGSIVGVVVATVEGAPERAVSTLSDLSQQLGALVADGSYRQGSAQESRRWVDGVVSRGELQAVYQPIVSLAERTVVGFEGLTRFTDGTRPDIAFARAASAGVGADLEVAAIERLLTDAGPLARSAWLSLNVSAATLLMGTVDQWLTTTDRTLVLEVTENEHVEDYKAVRDRLATLPGVGLAVDDAGSGYASLRHIFELRPNYIKLDRGWINGIDQDPVRQALVHALMGFSGAFGAQMVAEGVEREEEAEVLLELGVPLAQGYLFGRPAHAGAAEPWGQGSTGH